MPPIVARSAPHSIARTTAGTTPTHAFAGAAARYHQRAGRAANRTAAPSAPNTWTPTGTLLTARSAHTATLLPNGTVLVAGGLLSPNRPTASAELYSPSTGTWTPTGALHTARASHSATLFTSGPLSGTVLVAGGLVSTNTVTASAEFYNPSTGVFTPTGALRTARSGQTATLLPNGQVLMAGGLGNCAPTCTALASAELYNPSTGVFTPTGAMSMARAGHTATLLPNGTVLVSGGCNGGACASAELYTPTTGTWTATGAMHAPRAQHTATLFTSSQLNGQVLVAGGLVSTSAVTASAELYNPSTGTWSVTGAMAAARARVTATLLQTSQVLVAGGSGCAATCPLTSTELYDPNAATWLAVAALNTARTQHTATLLPSGQVLVAGGVGACKPVCAALAVAEVYTPGLNPAVQLSPPSLAFGPQPVFTRSAPHTLTVTNNGALPLSILAASLSGSSGANATFVHTGSCTGLTLAVAASCVMTVTFAPVALGNVGATLLITDNAPTSPQSVPLSASGTGPDAWAPTTGLLATARSAHSATLLPSGQVLVAGGLVRLNKPTSAAELYNPGTGTWAATGALHTARASHSATLLTSGPHAGQVLVAGGLVSTSTVTASAELYNPSTGTWTSTGAMHAARAGQTATLFTTGPLVGQVLVAGGLGACTPTCRALSSAELYNPSTGAWTATGSMTTARAGHTATLLSSGSRTGQVLVAGGCNGGACTGAELYNPSTGVWVTTGAMHAARVSHTATLLPGGGQVLVAGGVVSTSTVTASAELYNAATDAWTTTGKMVAARAQHTATLVQTGQVLVAGGSGCAATCPLTSTELYNPSTGTWLAGGTLMTARAQHSATLLQNGQVLVAGGLGACVPACSALASSELYAAQLVMYPPTAVVGQTVAFTGTSFSAGETVHIYADSILTTTPLFTTTAAALGNFVLTATVPAALSYGVHTLYAVGQRSNALGIVTLDAVRLTASPNKVAIGSKVVVNGSGFTSTEKVELHWNALSGPLLGTTTTDTNGIFVGAKAITFTVPLSGTGMFTLFAIGVPGGSAPNRVTDSGPPTTTVDTSPPDPLVATGGLSTARYYHTMTLLENGQVLVAGGVDANGTTQASAELYDPSTGTWATTGSMAFARWQHTATLLLNGQVLVAGGCSYTIGTGCGGPQTAELYDPSTGTWTATGAMTTVRSGHTATLLPNGQVLVAAGNGLYSAELYDPNTGTWTPTSAMTTVRAYSTATLLTSGSRAGQVLVAGGLYSTGSGTFDLSQVELFNPSTGTWALTGSMATARQSHTATLLPTGDVLVAGGANNCDTSCIAQASAELYDPNTGTWTTTGSMTTARQQHTATLLQTGQVLVAGGSDSTFTPQATGEIYDPNTGVFTPTGTMTSARYGHTATLLQNGQVLVAGGIDASGNILAGAELYNPSLSLSAISLNFGKQPIFTSGPPHTITVTNTGPISLAISSLAFTGTNAADFGEADTCSAVPLAPGGTCSLAVSFTPTDSGSRSASLLITDSGPISPQYVPLSGYGTAPNTWEPTGSMGTVRDSQTATLLQTGQVLVAGGADANHNALPSAELYDPSTGIWTPTGAMATARQLHTATLLPNGSVLVAGGSMCAGYCPTATAELYDPHTGTWTLTSSMLVGRAGAGRFGHTATLLPSGLVLVAGGTDNSLHTTDSAQVYDPSTGTWTATGNMTAPRGYATATLLPSGYRAGQVLVAGGLYSTGGGTNDLAQAELYNPVTGTWATTGSMAVARQSHTATLLPSGLVLVAGGANSCDTRCIAQAGAELYDPNTGTWTVTGSLSTARQFHTATLLQTGQVLVVGGCGGGSCTSTEVYDPSSGTWMASGALVSARYNHTATLLPNGQVLVAGGIDANGNTVAGAELYDTAITLSATKLSFANESLFTGSVPQTIALTNTGPISLAISRVALTGVNAADFGETDTCIGAPLVPGAGCSITVTFTPTATGSRSAGLLIADNAPTGPRSASVTLGGYGTVPNSWAPTGSMTTVRYYHTATLLPTGQVLVTGGVDANSSTLSSAELYDPNSGTWAPTGSMANGRWQHTATLLLNGKVLVAGGCSYTIGTGCGGPRAAELYDPSTGTWMATGAMTTVRYGHTATLLPNGQVLVVGGYGNGGCSGGNPCDTAELYDPSTGTWSATGNVVVDARIFHTATLLLNGQVLVAGGVGNNLTATASAELYNPGTGTWTATGAMHTARVYHMATLLPGGQVLVAGGLNDNGVAQASAESYDPTTGTWTTTGSMTTARQQHTATLLQTGQVLVAGGGDSNNTPLASSDVYDPSSGTWTATGSMTMGRYGHTATLLPSGQVLVAGSASRTGSAGLTASAELYAPALSLSVTSLSFSGQPIFTSGTPQTVTVTDTGLSPLTISSIAFTGLNPTDFGETDTCVGAPLAPGGSCGITVSFTPTATGRRSAYLVITDNAPISPQSVLVALSGYGAAPNTWAPTGSMGTARHAHTATLLPNGRVLVVGSASTLASAELYDPGTGTWTPTGSMITARSGHTAALLPSGQVLVAGGTDAIGNATTSAELYDPSTGTWTSTGAMTTARLSPTAALLPGGKVLVTGGCGNPVCTILASAELYDPGTGTWTATGTMAMSRVNHTATLLSNGQVLVAGGQTQTSSSYLTSAELYDPGTGTWTATGAMATGRDNHTATLLPNGQVLVAGGCMFMSGCVRLASAELYDPNTGTWTTTGNMTASRIGHTATLLPIGRVLVAGGNDGSTALASADLYDPNTGTWFAIGSMVASRFQHSATLLPSSNVLVAGGCGDLYCSTILASAEVYTMP